MIETANTNFIKNNNTMIAYSDEDDLSWKEILEIALRKKLNRVKRDIVFTELQGNTVLSIRPIVDSAPLYGHCSISDMSTSYVLLSDREAFLEKLGCGQSKFTSLISFTDPDSCCEEDIYNHTLTIKPEDIEDFFEELYKDLIIALDTSCDKIITDLGQVTIRNQILALAYLLSFYAMQIIKYVGIEEVKNMTPDEAKRLSANIIADNELFLIFGFECKVEAH